MSTNRDLIRRTSSIERQLTRLRSAFYDGALQRISEAQGGLRGSRFDAIASKGSPSDPTGSLALRERDVAVRHAEVLASAVGRMDEALADALEIVALYPPPHVGDAEDRAALERINGREPCCQNCWQLTLDNGQRRWEPIDANMAEASTVGGRLAEPMLLCQWCRKRTAAWGRLPTPDELARHHRGERVPWPRDVERTA